MTANAVYHHETVETAWMQQRVVHILEHDIHDEDIIIQTYTISIGKAGAEQLQAYVMEFKFIHNWGIFSTNIQLFPQLQVLFRQKSDFLQIYQK